MVISHWEAYLLISFKFFAKVSNSCCENKENKKMSSPNNGHEKYYPFHIFQETC